jgi:hypothetical protein
VPQLPQQHTGTPLSIASNMANQTLAYVLQPALAGCKLCVTSQLPQHYSLPAHPTHRCRTPTKHSHSQRQRSMPALPHLDYVQHLLAGCVVQRDGTPHLPQQHPHTLPKQRHCRICGSPAHLDYVQHLLAGGVVECDGAAAAPAAHWYTSTSLQQHDQPTNTCHILNSQHLLAD